MDFASIINSLLAPVKGSVDDSVYEIYYGLSIALIVLMGVAALAAIILVMLQPGNSQGIDALGGSSETFYGKNKGRSTEAKLKIATYVCLGILALFAVVFFILQYSGIWE